MFLTPRTVVAHIMGGLGNQLFCYAAARALALRTGRRLLLDALSGYSHDNYGRSFRLDRLPVAAAIAPRRRCYGGSLRDPRHGAARRLSERLPASLRSYLREDKQAGPEQLLRHRPRVRHLYLFGYWQDERYFTDHAEAVFRELTPPAPADPAVRALGERIAEENAVFLHVRRGRYPWLLPAGYYHHAMHQLAERTDAPRFYVFGDDPAWADEHLAAGSAAPAGRVTVLRPGDHGDRDELADLWLMTRCRHAVTANSSFSWWAGWLRAPDAGLTFRPADGAMPLRFPGRWTAVLGPARPAPEPPTG